MQKASGRFLSGGDVFEAENNAPYTVRQSFCPAFFKKRVGVRGAQPQRKAARR